MATAVQNITLSPSRDIPFNKLVLERYEFTLSRNLSCLDAA